jgi:hypothetical protein
MGLRSPTPANVAFVHVYALRTAFLGLCALALLWTAQHQGAGRLMPPSP